MLVFQPVGFSNMLEAPEFTHRTPVWSKGEIIIKFRNATTPRSPDGANK